MKQYKNFLPRYFWLLLLIAFGQLPLCAVGQDLSDTRWYFGNSPQWINFGNGNAAVVSNPAQHTPYGTAGSVVATHFRTGDLVFYSDGNQLIGPNNTPIATLPGDPTLPQPVHATPVPGVENAYNIFVLNLARELQWARYDATNPTAPLSFQSLNIGGTASGVMEVVRGATANGYVYWLVVPLQGNAARFALVRVNGNGAPASTVVTVTNNVPDFNPVSLAYSEETGLLAVGNAASGSDAGVFVYSFAADPAQPDPTQLAAVGALTDVNPAAATNGVTWLGDYLFVAKTTASGGNLYRYDFTDFDPADPFTFPAAAETVPGAAFNQNLDLRTGPNGEVYLLYRSSAGGASQVGRVRNPVGSSPGFVAAVTGTTNFNGTRFSRSAFPSYVPNPPFDFDYSAACTKAPIYFYPKFQGEGPERVEWHINGQKESEVLQPFFTFDQASTISVEMRAFYPGSVQSTTKQITITEAPELQIEQEYIICPNADSVITLVINDAQDNDVTDQYINNITWYKPQTVKEVGKDPVETGVKEITVATWLADTLDDGTFPEAGTYYVVVNTGTCELYAAFEVVVYNDEFSKANVWYFGDGAGINFNTNPPTPIGDSQMRSPDEAPEGTTISVDGNSEPLFYTNGETLWTRDSGDPDDAHDRAPNGNDLGGSRNASQNSLLIPHPSDPSLHYLFTISNEDVPFNKALRYNVADLKGNSATTGPDVELAQSSQEYVKARLLFPQVAEKLAGTSRTGWVIAHELNNNRFISYPVTQEGIGSPVFSLAGSVITEQQSKGYMVLSPNDSLLAVALPDGGSGGNIEIFRFNSTTGRVSGTDFVRIPVEGNGAPVYGVAFSPDSKRLFYTLSGAQSQLYQVSIDSAFTSAGIEETRVLVAEENEVWGALQLSPQGALYMARSGVNNLGVVQSPSDSLTAANASDAFRLDGLQDVLTGNSLLGLPNLADNIGRQVPDATVTAMSVCADATGNGEVEVIGTRRYNNEQYIFKVYPVNDPNTVFTPVSQEDSLATFSLPPGDYRVELELEACDLTYPTDYSGEPEVFALFSVGAKPEANIKNDDANPGEILTLCEDQGITLEGEALVEGQAQNPADYFFTWTNELNGMVMGNSPNQLVTEAGSYRLDLVNIITGCAAAPVYIQVADSRPEADLGDDIDICVGEALPRNELVATGAPANSLIRWLRSVNGSPFNNLDNTTSRQSLSDVNVNQPGTYRYVVEVRPGETGATCVKADTLTIRIVTAPLVTLRPTNNNCSGSTDLVATVTGGSGNYTYEFFRGTTSIGSNTTGTITVTESGTYTVQVTDGAADCPGTSAELVVDVLNGIQDLTIEVKPGCRLPGMQPLNEITAVTSYTGSVTYEWYRIMNGNASKLSFNDATIYVADGTYRVVARAGEGCNNATQTAEKEVISIPSPQSVIDSRYTICPSIDSRSSVTIDLSSYGYTGITWYNITSGQRVPIHNLASLTVYEPGTFEVEVEGCTDPARFTVDIDCTPVLFLPNAIRVGGQNNVFKILNPEMLENIESFEILIYNRWGEVIFRSTDAAFEWRGIGPNGKTVPMSNYPYLILYKNKYGDDRDTKKVHGSVFVMY
jgi:hypothetical protein